MTFLTHVLARSRWEAVWLETWSPELIKKAFESTGVWPFDPTAISEARVHDRARICSMQERMVAGHAAAVSTPLAELAELLDRQAEGTAEGSDARKAVQLLEKVAAGIA